MSRRRRSPGLQKGSATLDGAPLPIEPTPRLPWRTGWKAPERWSSTLSPEAKREPVYVRESEGAVLRPTLQPGERVLEVRYELEPGTFHGRAPTRERTVPYLLGPARDWPSFGSLRVEALLPEGWLADSAPALARDGDRLHGEFPGVPADLLVLTARAPEPWLAPELVYWTLGILGCLLVLWVCGRQAAGAAVAGMGTLRALGLSLVWALATGFGGGMAWFFALGVSRALVGSELSRQYFLSGYGAAIRIIFMGALMAPLGWLVAMGAYVGSRQRRPAPPAPPAPEA